MEWFGADGTVEVQVPCFVDFEGLTIHVVYDAEWRGCSYTGRDMGGGHFKLDCNFGDGWATLHRFMPEHVDGEVGQILEGSYNEGGHRGMWRIVLNAN